MPYASLTKKDETASKIPAPGPCGVGAFCSGGGYASLVTLPLTVVFVPPYMAVKAIIKKRREKKQAARGSQGKKEGEPGETQEEEPSTRTQRVTPGAAGSDGNETTLAPELEKSPSNPRVCDPECPGWSQPNCPMHRRERPDRPISPGLLAV